MGKNWQSQISKLDASTVFDEHGDEMECRHKTMNSQGNVGRIVWEDVGGHSYTGAFQGGDAGFIRLSSCSGYKKPTEKRTGPFSQTQTALSPSVAIKVLRDYVDSANAFGSHGVDGQESYDFFKNEVTSKVANPTRPEADYW